MKFFSPLFWISTLVFTVNQILEASGIFLPFIHSYLDDFLCSPIVLGFALFIQQQFTYRNRFYVLSAKMIVFFVIWYSLIFEVLLPMSAEQFRADPWDVVAYSLGGFLFYIKGNKPVKSLIAKKSK